MERVIIKSKDGKIRLQLGGGGSSVVKWTRGEQTKAIRGINTVSIGIETVDPVEFEPGDSLSAFGETYTLNLMPKVRKTAENRFAYDLTFESCQYLLSMVVFLDADRNGESSSAEFTLRCSLQEVIKMIVNNALRVYGPGSWAVGTLPTQTTEIRDFTFSSQNCLAVLQMICEDYGVDFRISENGGKYSVNVGQFGRVLPFVVKYGKGRGLYNLTRQNVSSSNIVTRLYAYGSQKNLPLNYRNYSNRLRLPDKDGTNGSYIEDPQAVKMFGVVEGVKIYDDIYPHFVGSVSGIVAGDVNSFGCADMNFDLNEKNPDGSTKYLVPGVTAKITFNSGGLAGYSFEVSSYDAAKKIFKILPYQDPRGFTFPNPTIATYQIKAGDEFVITDVYPRPEDLKKAEDTLLAEAEKYLKENSAPRVQYECTLSELFLAKVAGTPESVVNIFEPGDAIGLEDADLNLKRTGDTAIKITKFTRSLIAKTSYSYKLAIADVVETTIIERVIQDQEGIDTIIRINQFNDPYRMQRSWKTTQELLSMVFDQEGYFKDGNIKPNSIETQMLSVGAKAQQMLLRDIVIEPNVGGNPNVVRSSNGTLVHYGLFEEPRYWSITGRTETLTSTDPYYIYVRAEKEGRNASILFLQDQKKVEEGVYYYFILGVLHSVGSDNTRWISLTYGATAISGRFIKTGRIVSADGQTWFDLDSGEIHGNITFGNDNTSIEDVNKKADDAHDYIQNTLPGILSKYGEQIDGKIDTWYSETDPSIDWNSVEVKKSHIGDLWYNTNTKELKRFSSLYTWEIVQDKDAIKALEDASKAQDTADGKRRVFVDVPYPPYDVGDLWTNGTDLKRCIKAKASGAYDSADWDKATNYTGDEALNNFIENTYNVAMSEIMRQLDGIIETWFGKGIPTLNNTPASDWTTIKEKETHLGDLYYDNDTGIGYRFSKDGSTYFWSEVRDAGVTQALAAAKKAQDTADGKRRVFVATPYPPYDPGDLWASGLFLKRCIKGRTDGSYSPSDWDLATNYTGDENLNKFIDGVFQTNMSDIYNQLDGKAESWFTTTDPAGSWSSTEKKQHVGDLWYNPTAKTLKRYSSSYTWETIEDAKAIAAAEAASKAQDTADGKRRVFITTPYPPYDKGDLWTDGKDLRRCKVARASGSYYASDWELATNYTGDENLNKFIDEVFDVEFEKLKNQIDGKIEMYYQTSNPWQSWPSGTEPHHVGDLWYNTSTKELKRYQGPSSNTWNKIEDAASVAAAEAASKAQDTADGKRRVFVDTPYPPYDQGDLWTNGTFLKRCITSRASGNYVSSDWGAATNYDNTKTTIDGGIVTSGTIQLAGSSGSILAGITGVGTSSTSIRIWAGATFDNRASAPFRVQQNGEVFARYRIELQDSSLNGLAGICGSGDSKDNGVRFWAGSSYANRLTAPFRVDKNGAATMEKATIKNGCTIGSWRVSNGGIINESGDAYIIARAKDGYYYAEARIGTSVFPISSGLSGVGYFLNEVPDTYGVNYGVYVEVKNANKNWAVWAIGDIRCRGKVISDYVVAKSFIAAQTINADGSYSSWSGVDMDYSYDLDKYRMQFRNGILVGVKHE